MIFTWSRIIWKGLHVIPASAKLEVTWEFSKDFSGSDHYISCYYGQDGDSWKEVENDHMGLWTVKESLKSGSSNVSSGNFPEILYYI